LAACLLLGSPRVAHAQRARIAGAPRLDVTIGGGLVTGVSIGEADASLRANATAPQAYRLFSTDTRVRRAPVADLRFAGVITGRLAAEGQLIVGQSELQTAITNDVESAPSVTVSERLTQVMLGGGIRVRLGHVSRPGRTMPYVSGGAGLLRQVHEGRIATERSPVFYLGGGLRRALGSGPIGSSRMGVRADAQLLMVRGGLRLDDTIASRISAMGGVFFSF
jgi:hypothetical protein